MEVRLGLWGAIALSRSPSPSPTSPRGAAGSADVKELRGLSTKSGALPRLKLELLAATNKPYIPPAVNLFPVPAPLPAPPVVAAQPAAPPPPSPPPPDPFLEAAKQLRFVGYLKSDRGTAAIVTHGTQLYIASRGNTITERFRVVSVQDETVTLASPEGDKQVRLALAAASGAAAAGAIPAPVMVAAPMLGGGGAQGESAGNVVVGSEPATAKPTPVAGLVIRSRAERSEMYRARAHAAQQ